MKVSVVISVRVPQFLAFLIGALLWSACVGSVSRTPGEDEPPPEEEEPNQKTEELPPPPEIVPVKDETGRVIGEKPTFACQQSAAPASVALRKLTATQYKNSLRDVIDRSLGDANEAAAVWNSLADLLAKYPAEEREKVPEDLHGSYRQLDQDLQQAHVDVSYDVAVKAGAELVQGERLSKLVGTCATDSNAANDTACVDAFLERFAALALRRPAEPDDLNFYRSIYGTSGGVDRLALADVIATVLSAPQFLYMVEHGENEAGGKPGVYRLSPYELAARLSYQLTQTMPDAELWDAAKDGRLSSAEGYEAQVDRLMADSRGRNASREFFMDFLKVEDLPALDKSMDRKDFRAFAGDLEPNGALRQDMVQEPVDFFQHYTWTVDGTVQDLLSSDLSFARTSALARIYGVEAWSGQGQPPSIASGERPGFLTRAAFLSTGITTTRPVMKGVFIRQSVLCDTIPPPPENAGNTPVDTSSSTTREAVEAITEQQGTTCASCHQYLINGLGFATENFDSLGRQRNQEVLFDDAGQERLRKPVSTRSIPRVFIDDDREVEGAGDLMNRITESGKVEACLARSYFRHTFARWDNVESDGCVLERLRSQLAGGGSLKSMVRSMVLSDAFKSRLIDL